MNFRGKRVLITQNNLNNFAGSEIATLELVDFLVSKGNHVTVYALSFGPPISEEFSKIRGINVVTDSDAQLSFTRFDLVWVHHQILPPKMIDELVIGVNLPIVVFSHMSTFIPLELPYVNGLEHAIASVALFNSSETRDSQKHFFANLLWKSSKVYPNPVPKKYIDHPPKANYAQELNRVLIVSSHPPKELLAATENINKIGDIVVNIIGRSHNEKLITPDVLLGYDAVITIGKTVQYCLTLGLPVYCYDRFGGPGYLNLNNYKKAVLNNFSGRGFVKKTAATIEKELSSRYAEAINFARIKCKTAKQTFDIERNIDLALNSVVPKGHVKIDEVVAASYIANQQVVKEFIVASYKSSLYYSKKLSEELKNKTRLIAAHEPVVKELRALKQRKSVRMSLFLSGILGKIIKFIGLHYR